MDLMKSAKSRVDSEGSRASRACTAFCLCCGAIRSTCLGNSGDLDLDNGAESVVLRDVLDPRCRWYPFAEASVVCASCRFALSERGTVCHRGESES